jgi:hypothetical protein
MVINWFAVWLKFYYAWFCFWDSLVSLISRLAAVFNHLSKTQKELPLPATSGRPSHVNLRFPLRAFTKDSSRHRTEFEGCTESPRIPDLKLMV